MGKFQVWAYGMQGSDDILDGEFDTLEEALDQVRREWPYPMRLVLPNGEDYDFTNDSENLTKGEWRLPVIYNYMVLKDVEKQAPQIYLLKQIKNDPDLKFFLSRISRTPQNWDYIVDDDDSAIKMKKMETLLKLIHCGLIEFVVFHDGSGFADRKWRK